jgi:hypothetical protein
MGGMAEVVKAPDDLGRARGYRRYPWDEWTDGQWRHAVAGVDYDTPDESFRNRLYRVASLRGLSVRTHIVHAGRVAFAFTRRDG